ncbi:MAG: phosphonate ABC transporter, permease protein PhnE [Trueperaceae bacterium]|nr:phosphonate ABC transporter, permease protein PhnE [Trueperaceae bacterium]
MLPEPAATSQIPERPAGQRKVAAATLATFVALFLVSAWQTGFSVGDLATGTGDFFRFFGRMVPDWSYLPKVWGPILETIQIAYLGTLFGTALALPLLFLASANTTTDRVTLAVSRSVLTVLRSIPDLLYAALLAPILAIGPLPGVVALTLFSMAVLAKLGSETVEAADPGPMEAVRATGAGRNRVIVYAVVPQVAATMTSYILYVFEINVRASVIIGLVGAGGIGQDLLARLNFFAYGDVSTIIVVIFVLVLAIDALSVWARSKLI